MIKIWPDWMYEDERADNPHLALNAVRLGETWNGLPSGVVTAAEWRRFIGAHAANDRNGTYNPEGIYETDTGLVYIDTEGMADGETVGDYEGFPRVGTDDDGNALYEVSGWVWETDE